MLLTFSMAIIPAAATKESVRVDLPAKQQLCATATIYKRNYA
jgi:hypothetical protein